MKLSEIVETKFFPPICKWCGSQLNYFIENEGGDYTSGITWDDRKYKIEANFSAYIYANSLRASSKEEATKNLWKFFNKYYKSEKETFSFG